MTSSRYTPPSPFRSFLFNIFIKVFLSKLVWRFIGVLFSIIHNLELRVLFERFVGEPRPGLAADIELAGLVQDLLQAERVVLALHVPLPHVPHYPRQHTELVLARAPHATLDLLEHLLC